MSHEIENNKTDITVTGLKGLASIIPGIGGIVSELIGQTIPGQRIDRIAEFIKMLNERISRIEIQQESINTFFIDIFEDSALQALRALTTQRNEYLANFVTQAIGIETTQYEVKKKLIFILSELSDLDIEILKSFNSFEHIRMKQKFYCEPLAYGPYERLSDQEKNDYDAKAIAWHIHVSSLEKLGLLSAEYETSQIRLNSKITQPPVSGYKITTLGKLLLRSISFLNPSAT
jgi:hypothetical protein